MFDYEMPHRMNINLLFVEFDLNRLILAMSERPLQRRDKLAGLGKLVDGVGCRQAAASSVGLG